jgi:hypothetical protein
MDQYDRYAGPALAERVTVQADATDIDELAAH